MDSWSEWAHEVFETSDLGDLRRSGRLIDMAAQAGRRPSGRISEVFHKDADRQGAYDFIESSHVTAEAIRAAITEATATKCSCERWVYMPLDGTSLKLWDGTGEKDFGSIGTYSNGATGLKLYNAIAVNSDGVPIGVAAQVWWCRPREKTEKRHRNSRKVSDKETGFLLQAIDQVCNEFSQHAPDTRCWFQIDRGGDSQDVLRRLEETGHWFTVRAQADRKIRAPSGCPRYLRGALRREPEMGHIKVEISASEDRPARTARLAIHAREVTIRLRDKRTKRKSFITLNAVLVRETGHRKNPIDWLLLTNRPIETFEETKRVVEGYTHRWRIEEFHKTWKTGACNVESTQLHSSERVIKWATILSAVAVRIERLKYLARTQADAPASIELTPQEIHALVLLHSENRRTSNRVARQLSIAQAVRWIAELGGYTGRSSGGPPGTITIARGLERLQPAAQLLYVLEKK